MQRQIRKLMRLSPDYSSITPMLFPLVQSESEKANSCDGLEGLSSNIKSLGLVPIVEFLIESHVPAFNILHSIFLCSKPFLIPFVSSSSLSLVDKILEDPQTREQFLNLLNTEA